MPRKLFTAETARLAAIKSHSPDSARNRQIEPPQPEPIVEQPADEFHVRRLARVRVQWEALDSMIAEETEPAKLDRLIAALARIEEIERRLSSRSLPPTLRASDKRGSNRRPGAAPIPQPVVPSVPVSQPAPPQTPQAPSA